DVLTASLRANPIFYADGQLLPYGQYSRQRPGGPAQYDVNVTYPIDVSRKRIARTEVATRAKRVTEAQFQNAVRLQIGNVYTVFSDVLAARETVIYLQRGVSGLERLLATTQKKYELRAATPADVNRVRIQLEFTKIGLADAEKTLRQAKRQLASLLNISPL